MNFHETVLEVLKQNERFFTEDGELLRNAVVEASGKDSFKYNDKFSRSTWLKHYDENNAKYSFVAQPEEEHMKVAEKTVEYGVKKDE